ncbi:MAG: hypothetical protein U0Q16_11330 [Bryobacteraceae bacterium]
MAIAAELTKLAPDFEIRFVSYGTGAGTFGAHGHAAADLQLPDDPPPLEVLIRTSRWLERNRPSLAVVHEEPMAVAACRIFQVPAIYLTDWFDDPASLEMEALHYASEVVVLAEPGLTAEPPHLQGRIRYAERVVRPLAYTRADRDRARAELGIAPDACVISILPGGWATEARASIGDLIDFAIAGWPIENTRWFWIAGADTAALAHRFRHRPGVTFLEYQPVIERLMCASDVAITKANRGTVLELDTLGVPTVSITHGLNPIDEKLIAPLVNNRTFHSRSLTPQALVSTLLEARERGPIESSVRRDGARKAAAHIAMFAHRTALAKLAP